MENISLDGGCDEAKFQSAVPVLWVAVFKVVLKYSETPGLIG